MATADPTARRIVAMLPAHNEEASLAHAVAALRSQTRPPDEIMVIADNCTDRTETLALELGCTLFVTRDNVHKKAGGLNQAMSQVLPRLRDDDCILVQDADSYLDPSFLESAQQAYREGAGGICGVFRGRVESRGMSRILESLQANEYARYELDIRRQRGKVLVLTGTATLLRAGVLREVIAARADGRLPAGCGNVYDTTVLTEDNELSFALLHLGYDLVSPRGCTLSTETMPTFRELANQRHRWKRGALENLGDYGWTRYTREYWGRQLLALIGLVVLTAYLSSLVYGLTFGMQLHLFWIGVTVLFAAERVITVRRRGWRMMGVASLLVVEMVYDIFLQTVQARAFLSAALRTERVW